ncbi:MAG: primosomal protein N' (replication factor Y) [Geobacteraceae bacterium]|nr:MAG: primosomal protein N' (replication factor Y) [Geobacteraceae bacterium]
MTLSPAGLIISSAMTESKSPIIIEVAVPLPLDTTFHYAVPWSLAPFAATGVRVLVPFGKRKLTGYVIAAVAESGEEVREIIAVLDQEPLFTVGELEFLRWSAGYYLHPLGEVIKSALPAGINITSRSRTRQKPDGAEVAEEVLTGGKRVKTELFYRAAVPLPEGGKLRDKPARIVAFLGANGEAPASLLRREFGADAAILKRLNEKGFLAATEREVYRDPFREEVFLRDTPPVLNYSQAEAFRQLAAAIKGRAFAPFLLHGVTGSGKTEVYLRAIANVLDQGQTALVLVPEIALTPQLVRRFKCRFTCGIAVLHSGLSDGERFDEWRRIRRGEVSVAIGARSAIFAPLERIGVIVVDEEHDASYKQSEGFRYNARDLALVRGKMERACVILGSATPLVTSYHAAQAGKLGTLHLPSRVRNLPMPTVMLLDARRKKNETFLPELAAALGENLAAGGQTLLFLNRRGFATFLICNDCGHVLRCPNCSITLTYHQRRGRHFCHYCDFSIPAPSVCPECESPEIILLGRGTERVEEEVKGLFPEARVSRMDRDTTTGRGGHARVLKGVEEGSIDILVGTQMIAKGHDFPGVTLVGVISADATLNLPDFRSGERTFQLVSQVMGRAGRGDAPGKVLIQTLAPDHYAISRAAAHDFEGFYAEELESRREAGYPPFAYLAAITLSGNAAPVVEKWAEEAAKLLRLVKREQRSRVEVLGPVTAPLGKIRGRFRWQLLLKSAGRTELHRLLAGFRGKFKTPAVVRTNIDVDPVDML